MSIKANRFTAEEEQILFPIDHKGNKSLYYTEELEPSRLERIKNTDIFASHPYPRRTKLILTLAQTGHDAEIIEEMIIKGMDMVRINMSHDTLNFHTETMKLLTTATEQLVQDFDLDYNVPIAVDIKGREMRTGVNQNNLDIDLIVGEIIRLSTNRDLQLKGKKECVFVDTPEIVKWCKPGTLILLDDGQFELRVKDLGTDNLVCVIITGGVLGSKKSVLLPELRTELPIVGPKDMPAISFAIEHGADYIFLPRVLTADDVVAARTAIGVGGKDIKIIAKLEHLEAMKNIREIIKESDGIIFSRLDLGIELPPEKLPALQVSVIHMAHRVGKPVIIAGCLFPSIVEEAFFELDEDNDDEDEDEDKEEFQCEECEDSDFAKAILDGADCVMLSGESALGDPLKNLLEVTDFIRRLEYIAYRPKLPKGRLLTYPLAYDTAHTIAIGALKMAIKFNAAAIVVINAGGRAASIIAQLNPRCPVILISKSQKTARQSMIFRGIFPVAYTYRLTRNWSRDCRKMINCGLRLAKTWRYLENDDPIIILQPWKRCQHTPTIARLAYVNFDTRKPDPKQDRKLLDKKFKVAFA